MNQNVPTRLSHFTWRQERIFILKELRETLRDRRTIITLLAMPLLLYPLLGLGFRFLAFQQATKERPQFQIAMNSADEANSLSDLMLIGKQALDQNAAGQDTNQSQQGEASQPESEARREVLRILGQEESEMQVFLPDDQVSLDLEQVVAEGRADLAVRLKQLSGSAKPDGIPRFQIQLVVNQDSIRSNRAAAWVTARLEAAEREIIRGWLAVRRIEFLGPIELQRSPVIQETNSSAALSLLPLILLLMTVTGGVYPAIDLTAGERERNTLETLISLPVPKMRVLLAKFVAVVTVTMLTGLMNLIAMFVTLYSLQLDKQLLGAGGFTLGLACKLFCVLSVFALFYSAILLFLTSSARSFKEAQAYLIPLLLLSIGPGLIILIPGWSLGNGSAVLPLFNILLLSRDVLIGQVSLLPAIVSILSTVLYGLVVLALAAQIFGTDAVAVGSRSLWSDLLRRPATDSPLPSLALVLGGLAALFPLYFIASGLLSRTAEISASYRLTMSAVLTIVLFLGIPWALLRWQKISLRNGLALKAAHWSFFLVAVLMGLATWPLIFELVVLSQSLGFQTLDISRFEEVEKLLKGWATIPLPLILLAMAVVPGVCEELFFRGFLFNGLQRVLGGRVTVLLTALAFGLFHFVLAGGAAPERIMPSMLMGLLLGWVRLRSGSLLPGISLHVVHNACLLTISQFRDELAGWGLGGLHQTHLPITWIAGAGCLSLGCMIAVQFILPRPAQSAV